MNKKQKQEQEEAIAKLRKLLRKGNTVFTTLAHVSRSGMSRTIGCYVIKKNEPDWISYLVAKAVGYPFDDRKEGVKVGGCGMDMGFHLVHCLGRKLWPKGGKLPKNMIGRNGTDSRIETNGGYLLKQRWL